MIKTTLSLLGRAWPQNCGLPSFVIFYTIYKILAQASARSLFDSQQFLAHLVFLQTIKKISNQGARLISLTL